MAKTKIRRKNMAKTKKENGYVQHSTVWKAVGGGLNNPGARKIVKVGKHKILLERSERLDKYGNPVHTATYINGNGGFGNSYRSNGSATNTVCETLRRNNIGIKHKMIFPKRSKV